MPLSAEAMLISSVITNNDAQVALSRGVTTEMFKGYPDEWDSICTHHSKHRKAPSPGSFQHMYPEFSITAVDDTAHWADEVKRMFARRTLVKSMKTVADYLTDGRVEEAADLLHSTARSVAGAVSPHDNRDLVSSWDDILADVVARQSLVNTHGMAGVPTGFETLDERTGGPQPGDLWVIGARLGMGKTWTLLRMATMALCQGFDVQFNSLEMGRSHVGMRVHSLLAHELDYPTIKNDDLMRGVGIDIRAYRRFLKSLQKDLKGHLHITDSSRGRLSPMTVGAQIERYKPQIVFIDYITLMEKKGLGDWTSVAQLSNELKQVAMEHSVPIVVAAQLNRAMGLTKEPPGPEALAQSDAIGQDADCVITMRQQSSSVMVLKCVKYRHGVSGYKWYAEFRPGDGVFEEVTYNKALELTDLDHDADDSDD